MPQVAVIETLRYVLRSLEFYCKIDKRWLCFCRIADDFHREKKSKSIKPIRFICMLYSKAVMKMSEMLEKGIPSSSNIGNVFKSHQSCMSC